jgi:hypothetical protein
MKEMISIFKIQLRYHFAAIEAIFYQSPKANLIKAQAIFV